MSMISITSERGSATYVSWTNNRAIPVAHHDIVAVLQTVRARPITNAFLALFKFFE